MYPETLKTSGSIAESYLSGIEKNFGIGTGSTDRIGKSHTQSILKTELSKNLRLVVIDHHELFREGFLRILVMDGDYTPVSGPPAEARSLVQHFWPDLILLGLGTFKDRGIILAKTLRREFPAIKMLLLDESVRTQHVREVLAMKADGYWTKYANFTKIASAMKKIMSGESSFCSEVEKHLRKTPSGLRFDPPHEHPSISMLTRRETEMFLLLAQGLSITKAAELLSIAERKAESRRASIMQKLRANEPADLTRLAMKEGILQ
jgi:DNA-binding NarL/FixJ family response regulator